MYVFMYMHTANAAAPADFAFILNSLTYISTYSMNVFFLY